MADKKQEYRQQLDKINEMIATAKQNVADNSWQFIFWGWILIISSLSHFALFMWFNPKYAYLPWPILCGLGGILSMITAFQQKKERGVKSYLDQFLGYLWGSFVVALLYILFFSIYLKISPVPFVLAITGWATFVTGGTLRSKIVKSGGIVFWVMVIPCIWVPPIFQLLLFGGAIFLGYLIPGYMLRKQHQHGSAQ